MQSPASCWCSHWLDLLGLSFQGLQGALEELHTMHNTALSRRLVHPVPCPPGWFYWCYLRLRRSQPIRRNILQLRMIVWPKEHSSWRKWSWTTNQTLLCNRSNCLNKGLHFDRIVWTIIPETRYWNTPLLRWESPLWRSWFHWPRSVWQQGRGVYQFWLTFRKLSRSVLQVYDFHGWNLEKMEEPFAIPISFQIMFDRHCSRTFFSILSTMPVPNHSDAKDCHSSCSYSITTSFTLLPLKKIRFIQLWSTAQVFIS